MTEYLSYKFEDNEEFIDTHDELPLWSAPFGLLLLKHLELKPNMTVIDIGSGAGFPLMELAGRLGNSCKLYGLDIWSNANKRANKKIKNYGLTNVEIIESSAEKMPFKDLYANYIVSNLSINNFNNVNGVFEECFRVLKHTGKLGLTTNLNKHWVEFYTIFEQTLTELNKNELINRVRMDQERRGTKESISKLFTDNGFKICRYFEESFEMKFLDGSAFLNHYFVKLGWLSSWIDLIPEEDRKEVFSLLERNLNSYAEASGGLTLTVPMAYIEGEKP